MTHPTQGRPPVRGAETSPQHQGTLPRLSGLARRQAAVCSFFALPSCPPSSTPSTPRPESQGEPDARALPFLAGYPSASKCS